MILRCPNCEVERDFRLIKQDFENEELIMVLECPYCFWRREVSNETYINSNA